jgi:hypothetical protein
MQTMNTIQWPLPLSMHLVPIQSQKGNLIHQSAAIIKINEERKIGAVSLCRIIESSVSSSFVDDRKR